MNRFITSLIALASLSAYAQTGDMPKLVVMITVDQLRGDFLHYFSPALSETGFKRLMSEGVCYTNIHYDFPTVCRSSAIATLSTGTYPCFHGIASDKKFNYTDRRETSVLFDPAFLGNYTSESVSPTGLLVSTVGDELKLASDGKSDVYAIGPNVEDALLSAGRYANAAFWLEEVKGRWATSTYYKEIPWYFDQYNNQRTSKWENGMAPNVWTPVIQEKLIPYGKNHLPFKYVFYLSDKECFSKLKTSALINTEITDLTEKFFEYADFGKRSYPDMLAITYYAGNYKETINDEYSLEVQNTYIQLDKEISRLLSLVDQKVGLKDALIVLASTGYYDSKQSAADTFKPFGTFYPKRCTALLNMYLMAVYGQGNWVDGFYNNQIYLNKKQIEESNVQPDEIRQKTAEYVAQFSGVREVTTAGQYLLETIEGGAAYWRRGLYAKECGDVILQLQPGWIIVDEQDGAQSYPIVKHTAAAPLIFFGYRLEPANITRPVKAVSVAPSISYMLRIRPPNACLDFPLEEIMNY